MGSSSPHTHSTLTLPCSFLRAVMEYAAPRGPSSRSMQCCRRELLEGLQKAHVGSVGFGCWNSTLRCVCAGCASTDSRKGDLEVLRIEQGMDRMSQQDFGHLTGIQCFLTHGCQRHTAIPTTRGAKPRVLPKAPHGHSLSSCFEVTWPQCKV